jgi:hypothetical protein
MPNYKDIQHLTENVTEVFDQAPGNVRGVRWRTDASSTAVQTPDRACQLSQ